jgi:ribosomal protein S16
MDANGKIEKTIQEKDKLDNWVKNGAIVSPAVNKILENKYTFKVYNPKAEKKAVEAAKKAAEAQ